MNQTTEEFFHDFRQDLLASSISGDNFQLYNFMENISKNLIDCGVIEGFELCHYRGKAGKLALRVDGFGFTDDGVLNLFIADFDSRSELASLTKTDIDSIFKKITQFASVNIQDTFYDGLDETSPEYGLSRQLYDRKENIRKINFYIFSERTLSSQVKNIEDIFQDNIISSFHIWDMSRLHRQASSQGQKESIEIDLIDLFGTGLPCLPAHMGGDALESYLVVIPGNILSSIYEKYDASLLEQNVRCFLQAKGSVNKGIKSTILNEPDMFFAYNNGITATAKKIITRGTDKGLLITAISDLQIVNGGQTTASLFHTQRKEKVSLDKVFVQMKLSIVDQSKSEEFVPKISEYANTQNRVNAADFFSNHPFHIKIQEFSRKIWAPAKQGELRETKWFYERARGQYANELTNMNQKEQGEFKSQNPKNQMFTKTDLAKFENVWDEHPKWVNLGAQKNFTQYASRIAQEWKSKSEHFNEYYFKRAISRGIIFQCTEKLVSSQDWYNGGYRANIVAYTLAFLSECCKKIEMDINYDKVWKEQSISNGMINTLKLLSSHVNKILLSPSQGISNISEWAKKEACWEEIKRTVGVIVPQISKEFKNELILLSVSESEAKDAKKRQKIDAGIHAQKEVIKITNQEWKDIAQKGLAEKSLTEKEIVLLQLALSIPQKIPNETQSKLLLDIIKKVK
ncbi:AIPR family protein [Rahnella sp. Lac-M11]|uniref:AIPR family protein n=2 Tax=Rahnella contaminans TaxID=2703882 RepID=A0A6M2B3V3_9GAMM|nr:AIPR family protein [Rahnella contaminans]